MKFIRRLISAYKLVKQQELTTNYAIEQAGAEEIKELSMDEARILHRKQQTDAIRAIQEYEGYV